MIWTALAFAAEPDDGWEAAGRPETAAIVLDERLDDPRAALARFALAARLGDDRALVLPDPLPETLPWSTRDRAHLVLGRRAAEAGDEALARAHLGKVFPDSPAWPEARLMLGDLERRAGRLRDAALAYRDAVGPDADGDALLRIAGLYTELERWDTVLYTLQVVPRSDPAWAESLAPLARAQLATGDVGWALGTLVVLADPSIAARTWAPDGALLLAAGEGRPTAPARAELARLARAIGAVDLGADPWAAWFGGEASAALPTSWSVAFLRREDVAPLLERVGRIDRELAMGEPGDPLTIALAERRAATVAALGEVLARGLAEERVRLLALAEGPDPVVAPARAPVATLDENGVWWPYNGELWADELAVVGVP